MCSLLKCGIYCKMASVLLKLSSSCLLSFLGVFLIARNRPKIKQQDRNFIAMDKIPGKFVIDVLIVSLHNTACCVLTYLY